MMRLYRPRLFSPRLFGPRLFGRTTFIPPWVDPSMSVYYEILVAMRDQIRTYVDLSGADGLPGIEADAVVIRKVPRALDPYSKWADEKTPGVILSPSPVIHRGGGGLNSMDFWRYPVLLQILHHSEERADDTILRLCLDWEERLAKYFHHGNLRLAVTGSPGFVFHTWTDTTNVFEERNIRYHHNCVMALAVVAESESPRDPQGAL